MNTFIMVISAIFLFLNISFFLSTGSIFSLICGVICAYGFWIRFIETEIWNEIRKKL